MQVPVQEILAHPFLSPLERLARLTPGYAGSDIRDVVHHGTPQDEHMERITYESLLLGLSKVRFALTFIGRNRWWQWIATCLGGGVPHGPWSTRSRVLS